MDRKSGLTLHNFPIPHTNELIYSTVARAGVRFGITSPKRLLDEVFDNRTVVATMDIPSNLSCISNQLKNTGKYSVEKIIYQHTMFPLYALFVNEKTRLKIINKMKGNTKGIAHLSLGITASKMKIPKNFYFCPKCVKEQLLYGETYWSREWYLPELPCPKHHTLNILDSSPQDSRHYFQPCSNILESESRPVDFSLNSTLLVKKAKELLEMPVERSPTANEWAAFYKNIAFDNGLIKGNTHIRHQDIFELVQPYLISSLKCDSFSDITWLRSIFRKHRNSFNYLQHLTIWQTFMPEAPVCEIIKEVKKTDKIIITPPRGAIKIILEKDKLDKRILWEKLIVKSSVQVIRENNGGALYAWLYRHDKKWLMEFNAMNKFSSTLITVRVDWHKRDKKYSKQLLSELNDLDLLLAGPRRSKLYLVNKLENSNFINRKINHLPILKALLARYSESIFEYQARRLTCAAYQLFIEYGFVTEWRLLRLAGLSQERIHLHNKNLMNFITNEWRGYEC